MTWRTIAMRLRVFDRVTIPTAGALAIALLAVGSGCEKSNGVRRIARLSKLPDPACVRTAIEHVPGIRGFSEWQWPETGGEVQEAEEVRSAHHFAYDGDQARVQLGIFDDGGGQMRLVQSCMRINEPLPQEMADEARRLMLALEQELAQRCGVAELDEGVRESCSGVECD